MSNGEEYLLGEIEGEISKRENLKPDFTQCGVSSDFAECQHYGTTLLLKDALIRQKKEVEKTKQGVLMGGVKLTGWAGVAASVVYLMAKAHGVIE